MADWRGTVTECGIDWLTATCKQGTLESVALRDLALSVVEEEARAGHDTRQARAEGYVMVGAGGCMFGSREEDVLVRLSGSTAAHYWDDFAPLASNVSRADLQVTTMLANPDLAVHQKHRREFRNREKAGRGRPPKVEVIEGERFNAVKDRTLLGATLSVGDRISDVYLRAYDKGAERVKKKAPPPHRETRRPEWVPGVWWRYESELKRDVARETVRALLSAPYAQRVHMVRAMVHKEFARKGFRPRFAAKAPGLLKVRTLAGGVHPKDDEGEDMPNVDPAAVAAAEIVRPSRARTDDERRLDYVQNVIGPLIARLVDAGRGDEVLAALAPALTGGEKRASAKVRQYAADIRAGRIVSERDVSVHRRAPDPIVADAYERLTGRSYATNAPLQEPEVFHVEHPADPAQIDALDPWAQEELFTQEEP